MDVFAASAIVSEISYKPGWEIWSDAYGDHLLVKVRARVQDSRAAEIREIVLTQDLAIDARLLAVLDEPALVDHVFGRLLEIERHEAQEWYRYRGVLVNDPHGPCPGVHKGLQ